MLNFRKFFENEAAPVMGGAPTQPSSDDADTYDDPTVLDKELGISKSDRKDADYTATFTCHAVIDFPESGIKIHPPTELTVKPLEDGNYEITVLAGSGGTNPQKIQNLNGTDYTGPLKDYKRIVSGNFINWLKSHAWKAQPAADNGSMGMGMDMGGGGGLF